MTPAQRKRAAATEKRLEALKLIREAAVLDGEANAQEREQREADDWYARENARQSKNAPA